MTSRGALTLSKSRFMAGLQCLKRLYLETYHRELADPQDAATQAILESGTGVGELARQRFPGGTLIDEPYYAHTEAVAATARALRNEAIPHVYEASFAFEGIRTRVDVLSRNGDGDWDMVEVKSSASVKDDHVPDAAIQLYVLEGAGLSVSRAFIMHLDTSYVYTGGEYELESLFRIEDVTERVRGYLASMPDTLSPMWEALALDDAPEREIGRHCTRPYTCSFHGLCHRDLPEHYVGQLPGARVALINRLRGEGILDIRDIPPHFSGLTQTHRRVRDAVAEGEPYVGAGLAAALDRLEYPVHFLDFETFNPALPVYPMTSPYQVIPFQWSLHVLDADGELTHRDYLHDGADDPREAFAASLLDAVGPEGDVLVYSSYEKTITRRLAEALPQYRDALSALSERYLDLLGVVRAHYYHPDFHGSYSLKAVLPVLVPDLAYDDLDIQEGGAASVAYARMIAPDVSEAERAKLRDALLAYCGRDTLALVRVVDALRAAAG